MSCCIGAIATVRVGGVTIGLDLRCAGASESRWTRIKLQDKVSNEWEDRVIRAYSASVARSDIIRQAIMVHRITHENGSFDLIHSGGSEADSGVGNALVGISTTAERHIKDLRALSTSRIGQSD